LEAAEWLRKTCPAPEDTPAQSVPRLRAIVVDLGPDSGLARDSLKRFSDRFPGIAILVHGAGATWLGRPWAK
jgi:hypothetical protein